MIKYRVFATSRAVDHRGPLQPMTPMDAYFWRHRKDETARREQRKAAK